MNAERPATVRPRVSTRALLIACTLIFVLLTTDAVLRSRGELDYDLMRAVRRIDFPGASTMFHWFEGTIAS